MNLVVIPAYNEEATVGRVVRSVRALLHDVAVLVVNDRSADGTARVAEQAGARVINTHGSHGYGAAMISGFSFALREGFDFLATIDADGQHDPRSLSTLFESALESDIASGSRYHRLSPVGRGAAPPERVRVNREFTELINRVTGWSLTDAFCGLKAYRVAALSRVHLTETGYGLPLQFWIQARRAGLKVVEVPVERIYRSARREFGGGLDDPEKRCEYYYAIVLREVLGQTPSKLAKQYLASIGVTVLQSWGGCSKRSRSKKRCEERAERTIST